MEEPRGSALSRLGLVQAEARLGREASHTAAEQAERRTLLNHIGRRHARALVDKAAAAA